MSLSLSSAKRFNVTSFSESLHSAKTVLLLLVLSYYTVNKWSLTSHHYDVNFVFASGLHLESLPASGSPYEFDGGSEPRFDSETECGSWS